STRGGGRGRGNGGARNREIGGGGGGGGGAPSRRGLGAPPGVPARPTGGGARGIRGGGRAGCRRRRTSRPRRQSRDFARRADARCRSLGSDSSDRTGRLSRTSH